MLGTTKKIGVLVALIALLSAAGCATRQQTGTLGGAAVGGLAGHAITGGSDIGTLFGAIAGAAVGGEIGRQLDEADRRQAAYALEYNPAGVSHTWVNPDSGRQYAVTPTDTYRRSGGEPCREFVFLSYVDGQPEEVRGTACRARDGSWRMAR